MASNDDIMRIEPESPGGRPETNHLSYGIAWNEVIYHALTMKLRLKEIKSYRICTEGTPWKAATMVYREIGGQFRYLFLLF
jgi:hypothetical protein